MKENLKRSHKIMIYILIAAVSAVGGGAAEYKKYYSDHENHKASKETEKVKKDKMYEAYRKGLMNLYKTRKEGKPLLPDGNHYQIMEKNSTAGESTFKYRYFITDITGDHVDDLILYCNDTDSMLNYIFVFDYNGTSVQNVPIGQINNDANNEANYVNVMDDNQPVLASGLSLYKDGIATWGDCCVGFDGDGINYYRYNKKTNSYRFLKRIVLCNEYSNDGNGCKVHYSKSDSRSTSDYFKSIYAIAYEPDDSEYLDKNDTVEYLSDEDEYQDYIKKLTDNAGDFNPEWIELTEENIKGIPNDSAKKSESDQVLHDVTPDASEDSVTGKSSEDKSGVLSSQEPQLNCGDQKALGTVRVLVDHLYLRVNPNVPEDGNYGYSPKWKIYQYYKTTTTEHYKWYKVSDCDDVWLADPLSNPGSYLEITDSSQ